MYIGQTAWKRFHDFGTEPPSPLHRNALGENASWKFSSRYMVVLRMGGVYADIDTECRKPLNNVILPRDTLVVGWENEFSTAEEALSRKYVRKRQVGGHVPASICHLHL